MEFVHAAHPTTPVVLRDSSPPMIPHRTTSSGTDAAGLPEIHCEAGGDARGGQERKNRAVTRPAR
jgi:hypothetical protein